VSASSPVPFQQVRTRNGMAVASLICGLLWPFCLTAILAVIFGHIAISAIDRSQGLSAAAAKHSLD